MKFFFTRQLTCDCYYGCKDCPAICNCFGGCKDCSPGGPNYVKRKKPPIPPNEGSKVKQFIITQLRKLRDFLDRLTVPTQDELVLALVLHVSSLELAKDEFVEFAPLKGCCGPFQVSGNGLPVFEYMMFEKPIMEFVKVRVEIAKPNIIRYVTSIHARPESSSTPELNGKEIETSARHMKPFQELSRHLFRYFGHYVTPEKRMALR